jgi:competence protein ComEA
MGSWFERNRAHLATLIASVGIVGLLQWWVARPPGVEIRVIEPTLAPTATITPSPTPAPIAVYVSGEVARPDVYLLAASSRVVDAISAAGGFTAGADQVVVNLAQPLSDGMHVHVPARGEAPTPAPLSQAAPADSTASSQARTISGPININTASPEELDLLPGIGPAIAQRIVEYRTTNGPFRSIEEIKQVSGIGDKLFEKIRDLITV